MGGVTGVCPHCRTYDNTRRRSPCAANQVRCTSPKGLPNVGSLQTLPATRNGW
jgi:hypothetical protein